MATSLERLENEPQVSGLQRLAKDKNGKLNEEARVMAFLYMLLRDHLAFGKVERIMMEVESLADLVPELEDATLAVYVHTLAQRLLKR